MNRFASFAALAVLLLIPGRAGADREAAKAPFAEGSSALQRQDLTAAIAAFTKAIEADPSWADAWDLRGRAKFLLARTPAAIEDYSRAMSLEPANPNFAIHRCQALMSLDRWAEAAEDADAGLKASSGNAQILALHGWALVNLGEVDKGLAEQDQAFQANSSPTQRIRYDAYWRKADWEAMVKEADAQLAGGVTRPAIHFYRVIALVGMGKHKEALDAARAAKKIVPRGSEPALAEAYVLGTSEAAGIHDADASLKIIAGTDSSTLSYYLNVHARTLFLAGRARECAELLGIKGRRTNFDTLFWLGAAQWKLGAFAEARQTLSDARRLNPYLARHALQIEGLAAFVASIDKELAGEGAGQQDRGRLSHELATHLLTVAEIEALVRRYQFARAASEYERLLQSLTSAVRKAEVETRLPEIRGMAGAHSKISTGVNKGSLKLKATLGKTELTVSKAAETIFEFAIAGGSGKFPWAFLDPAVYCGFADQAGLEPAEDFGIGCLAWDAAQREIAVKHFEDAVKKKPALRKNLDAFLARKRGLSAPPDGFVLYRGSYVTPEEKGNLEKGLVLFQGQWVTVKDREQLAKGNIQVDGKWVPGAEGELLKRGYVKYKDKWLSREDYDLIRGQWADCHTEETAHYLVKSNTTEQFAKDLGTLLEVAYAEYAKFYGGAEPKLPGKEKMTLHAYRSYEDYRKYCVENKQEDHLNAAGFARSDSNVVVGWDKTGNKHQFLQTMVHEAAHLYFFRVAPSARPPSWYAEGMATYFEGFDWDGKTYRFNFISDSRVPFVRDAMRGGRHIPLKDLLAGDALQLINSDSQKALLFYAECWALNYYLSQTDNKGYGAAYEEYRKNVASGGGKALLEYFPDAARLEKDWVECITGL
ncbi:MAG: Tetratricopeptide [Planctomycetota bacterium]|nr:MAG: Tetratricopeptide [Planctomycetota bacterium]